MSKNKFKGDIEEQDISELKKKSIKSGIKKTIVGIIVAGTLISTAPNIHFYSNLFFSKRNSGVVEVVGSKEYSLKEKAEILLELGINKNNHLSEQEKNEIVTSFEKYVIEEYSESFTERYLYNMYASAKTLDVKYVSRNFLYKYSWWSGDFNSYFNNIYIPDNEKMDQQLLAHEFLHASLKKGLLGSGLTSGIRGYGFNEGLTSSHVVDDYCYAEEHFLISYIGCILGIDKVEPAYFNSDLNSIKQELNKYLSNWETEKLIRYCDIIVFTGYLDTFLNKLGIDFGNTYLDILDKYVKESIDLLRKLFTNKTGLSATDSSYGRILFGKGSIADSDTIDEPFYYITFADARNYSIVVHYFCDIEYYSKSYVVSDLSTFDIDKALEDITKVEDNSNTKNKQ